MCVRRLVSVGKGERRPPLPTDVVCRQDDAAAGASVGPSIKLFAWDCGGDMEDMCYERRRAEACVDAHLDKFIMNSENLCVYYVCGGRSKVKTNQILYFLLLLAVSNYDSGSHIYLFWQKSPVELITIGSRPALRGHPSTFFGVLKFLQHLSLYRHSLLCTYCTNSRSRGL